MNPRRIAAIIVLVMFSTTWRATGLAASEDPALPATSEAVFQLLVNPGMEEAFIPYGFEFLDTGVACKVAAGWSRFGDVEPRPCWMDARDFAHLVAGTDWVERMTGETSQVIISNQPYTAGIYQQVGGLTPGLPYGFHAAMTTIYQTSAGDPQPGHMIKQVGIDPTGGTNPNAPTVVWSEPQDQDRGWDTQQRTSAVAASSTMTAFIRVISDDPVQLPYLNQSFFDSALFARTATVSAVSPEQSLTTSFIVRWDNAVASPGAVVDAYNVQWMDESDGQWVDWLTETSQTQATFTGSWWHTYRFRASARQHYYDPGSYVNAYLFSPYAPEEGAPTTVVGAKLAGSVRGNGPYAWVGATVSILGTPYTAVSGYDGRYRILMPPLDGSQTVTVSHLPWLSPDPVYGVGLGAGETAEADWALRPPDDAVQNGAFEVSLADWEPIFEQGAEPAQVDEPIHTGLGAAMLGGPPGEAPEAGYVSSLQQTSIALANSWNPNLAFWYLPEAGDQDDQFSVRLTVTGDAASSDLPTENTPGATATAVDLVFNPSLDVEGWQHQWYSLGVGEAYFTGTVTIQFEVWNDGDESPTTVYLDEVSLGRTPGGPFRFYMPLVGK